MPSIIKATLGGKLWTLRWVNRLGKSGDGKYGDWFEHNDTRRIRIRRAQSEKDELDTVIHEALHVCGMNLTEEWVTQTANELTALLYDKLGYRREA